VSPSSVPIAAKASSLNFCVAFRILRSTFVFGLLLIPRVLLFPVESSVCQVCSRVRAWFCCLLISVFAPSLFYRWFSSWLRASVSASRRFQSCSQLLASTSVLVPWRQLRQGRTLVHFLTENRPGVRTGSVPSKPNSLLPVSDPRRLLLLLSPVSGIRRQVKRCCCPSFGFPILSVVCSVGLLSIVVVRSRYSSWVIGSKDSRFRGSNCTFAVVCRTRPPGVRWNVCGDINYFLSWFISSISYEVFLAPFCVFIVVASTVLRADSLTIARWSWPS
jgi:hypothetical protein